MYHHFKKQQQQQKSLQQKSPQQKSPQQKSPQQKLSQQKKENEERGNHDLLALIQHLSHRLLWNHRWVRLNRYVWKLCDEYQFNKTRFPLDDKYSKIKLMMAQLAKFSYQICWPYELPPFAHSSLQMKDAHYLHEKTGNFRWKILCF